MDLSGRKQIVISSFDKHTAALRTTREPDEYKRKTP